VLIREPIRQLPDKNFLAQFLQDFPDILFRVTLRDQVDRRFLNHSRRLRLRLVGSAVCSQSRRGCLGFTTIADRFSIDDRKPSTLKRHAVRNGGGAHRPLTTPPLFLTREAVWSVEWAHPWQATDEFASGCNTQSTISTHASDPARGRRSRDQDIPCISTRLAVLRRHFARVSGGTKHFLDAKPKGRFTEYLAVIAVTIAQQITRSRVPGECLQQLLGCPFRGRMAGHREVNAGGDGHEKGSRTQTASET
jgi:hypothetical protein